MTAEQQIEALEIVNAQQAEKISHLEHHNGWLEGNWGRRDKELADLKKNTEREFWEKLSLATVGKGVDNALVVVEALFDRWQKRFINAKETI